MWIYSPISSIRRRILLSYPSNWSMNPSTPSLHLIDLCVYFAITMLLTGISSVHAGVAKSTIWLELTSKDVRSCITQVKRPHRHRLCLTVIYVNPSPVPCLFLETTRKKVVYLYQVLFVCKSSWYCACSVISNSAG